MNRRIWIAAILIACLGIDISCMRSPKADSTPITEEKEQSRVLIAARQSEFKSEIIKKIETDYKNRAVLTVVDIGELNNLRPSDYNALIVLGERMGWLMFSAKERHFLRHLENTDKLILVMTAADKDWQWERTDVDVITGASQKEALEPIYQEITKRLEKLLPKVNH